MRAVLGPKFPRSILLPAAKPLAADCAGGFSCSCGRTRAACVTAVGTGRDADEIGATVADSDAEEVCGDAVLLPVVAVVFDSTGCIFNDIVLLICTSSEPGEELAAIFEIFV